MPRRGKRTNCDKKNQLLFIESPVNIRHTPPSPAGCAENPPTAKVVPVDEYLSVPWVSPQFRKHPTSGLTKKKSQRKKYGDSTLANTTLPRRQLPEGFVPLRFVGQDLTFSGSNRKNRVENSASSALSNSPKNFGKVFGGQKKISLKADDTADEFSDSWGLQRPATENQGKGTIPSVNDHAECVHFNDLSETLELQCGMKEMRKNEDVDFETDSCPTDGNVNNIHDISKRLFTELSEKHMEGEKSLRNDSRLRRSQSVPMLSRVPHMNWLDISHHNDAKFLVPPSLFSTPPPTQPRTLEVLVYDTPKEEYGLSYREIVRRRLMCDT